MLWIFFTKFRWLKNSLFANFKINAGFSTNSTRFNSPWPFKLTYITQVRELFLIGIWLLIVYTSILSFFLFIFFIQDLNLGKCTFCNCFYLNIIKIQRLYNYCTFILFYWKKKKLLLSPGLKKNHRNSSRVNLSLKVMNY